MSIKSIVEFECSICKRKYPTMTEATLCLDRCKRINEFRRKYPRIPDPHLHFANGGGWIQRTKEWQDEYVEQLDNLIKANHPEIYHQFVGINSYDGRMGRILSDSNFDECEQWNRLICICDKCYREWGQPYYAIHCHHDGRTEEGYGGGTISTLKPEWKEPRSRRMNPSVR